MSHTVSSSVTVTVTVDDEVRGMAETHEIYPSASVSSVAVEIRLPGGEDADPLGAAKQQKLGARLGPDWVLKAQRLLEGTIEVGPAELTSTPRELVVPQYLRRDLTSAMLVTPGSVGIETAAYTRFEDFIRLVESCLLSVVEVTEPQGMIRVGIRYTDEFRIEGIERANPGGWAEWVDPTLLPPGFVAMRDAGITPSFWTGEAPFALGHDRGVILRYGPRPGPIRYPNGPLRRPTPPDDGPWFLLDFDASWAPTRIPAFDIDSILGFCSEVHEVIHALFESLLTDKLREWMRRETHVT